MSEKKKKKRQKKGLLTPPNSYLDKAINLCYSITF